MCQLLFAGVERARDVCRIVVKEGGELSAALHAEQPYPASGHRVRDLQPLRFVRGNDARPLDLATGIGPHVGTS